MKCLVWGAVATAMVLYSCAGTPRDGRAEAVTVSRLDSMIMSGWDGVTDSSVMAVYAEVLGADSVPLSDFAASQAESRAYRAFWPAVESVYPEMSASLGRYGRALAIARSELPDIEFPDTLAMVVSPYRQTVILAGNIGFVVSNHFLGEDFEGYEGFQDAVRRLKTPGRAPVEVVEAAIRSRYDTAHGRIQLVGRMFHEGAVVMALVRLFPDVPIKVILGVTSDQMQWLGKNEAALWNEIAGRDLLFSTDPAVAGRLLDGVLPDAGGLLPGAPERAARYIGYRMALNYADKNPDIPLSRLLSADFAMSPDLLQQIDYHP